MTSPLMDSTHGRQRPAWHDITPIGQNTGSDDVERGTTSQPLDSTHSQMTLGVACHHLLWTAHNVERHRALHAIFAFGRHTRLNNVGRGMPSSPLGSTQGQTTLGVARHHNPWTARMVKQCQALHDITAFGKHTRSNDVKSGMQPSPLGSTNSRTTLGWHAITAIGQHTQSNNVRCGMPSSHFESTDGEQRQAWHAIIAYGQHTR